MTLQIEKSEPAGGERLLGTDELFFSTTDQQGVIRSGNAVFARICGYTLDEMVGSPHNIVRHPDMPGGFFKAMWDRLLRGKPMAGYLLNLAGDGSFTWCFSTVVPAADGFLAVRMAPMCPSLSIPMRQTYRELRARERAALAGGLSPAEVAELGERELDRSVQRLGFSGYGALIAEALPAEISARTGMATVRYSRPAAHGAVAEILAGAKALDGMLAPLVARLGAYRELSAALASVARPMVGAGDELEAAATAARAGSMALDGSVRVIQTVAQTLSGPCRDAATALRDSAAELDVLRRQLNALRFRIALAQLHNDLVATCVGELIDGVAPPVTAGEIPLLCHVLQGGMEQLAAGMAVVNARLDSVGQSLITAGESLNDARRFLGKWRLMVQRHRLGGRLEHYLDPIDRMLSDGHEQLSQVNAVGVQCRASVFHFEGPPLDAQLARIRRAVLEV